MAWHGMAAWQHGTAGRCLHTVALHTHGNTRSGIKRVQCSCCDERQGCSARTADGEEADLRNTRSLLHCKGTFSRVVGTALHLPRGVFVWLFYFCFDSTPLLLAIHGKALSSPKFDFGDHRNHDTQNNKMHCPRLLTWTSNTWWSTFGLLLIRSIDWS